MTKVRILLFLVLFAAAAALYSCVGYMNFFNKTLMALLIIFEGTMVVSSALLIGVTFFSLDEKGQLAKNTFAWKYFSKYYTYQEKNGDGEIVRRVEMPEQLKMCPMFWMVVGGVFYISLLTLLIVLAIFMFGTVIYIALTQGIEFPHNITWTIVFAVLLNSLSFCIFFFGLFILLAVLCVTLFNEKKWGALVLTKAVIALAGFYAILSMDPKSIQWQSLDYLDLMYKSIMFALIFSAIVETAVTAVVLLTLGCARMKNTLPGQLILSLYKKFCPSIPIETKDQIEKAVT